MDIHVGPPESKNPFRKMCAEWKHIANNWILLWKHMHIPWDWNLKQAIFNGNCWVFIFRSIFFKFISWHHMVSVIASNRFSVRCPSILCFAQSDFILAIWSIKKCSLFYLHFALNHSYRSVGYARIPFRLIDWDGQSNYWN